MPHITIDCSENILKTQNPEKVLQHVFNTAYATGLFHKKAIKVRLNPFQYYYSEYPEEDFIHVFASIMEGRNTTQKQLLSKKVVATLNKLFPKTNVISMNIINIEKASYCNKTMI